MFEICSILGNWRFNKGYKLIKKFWRQETNIKIKKDLIFTPNFNCGRSLSGGISDQCKQWRVHVHCREQALSEKIIRQSHCSH